MFNRGNVYRGGGRVAGRMGRGMGDYTDDLTLSDPTPVVSLDPSLSSFDTSSSDLTLPPPLPPSYDPTTSPPTSSSPTLTASEAQLAGQLASGALNTLQALVNGPTTRVLSTNAAAASIAQSQAQAQASSNSTMLLLGGVGLLLLLNKK